LLLFSPPLAAGIVVALFRYAFASIYAIAIAIAFQIDDRR
jgi:hypothetical protein